MAVRITPLFLQIRLPRIVVHGNIAAGSARLLIMMMCCALLLGACSAARPAVPVGEVPQQGELPLEDERYGHEVLNQLTSRYPLDSNDQRIARVRDIADKLTAAAKASHNPWHVYVLADDKFENAAATRGNYLFVWTGLLNKIQNDSELAVVIAHEIAHVLAGHPKPTPSEEVGEILAGVGGIAAREVAAYYGAIGIAAQLAEILVSETLKAIIVNPESQRKELEADHIGLFLLADAGYDPREAIQFWRRMAAFEHNLDAPLQFLSSHPSNEERFAELEKILPEAEARWRQASSPDGMSAADSSDKKSLPPAGGSDEWVVNRSGGSRGNGASGAGTLNNPEWTLGRAHNRLVPRTWVVAAKTTAVYAAPEVNSFTPAVLVRGTNVTVVEEIPQRSPRGIWLRIDNPQSGYLMSGDLYPHPDQ